MKLVGTVPFTAPPDRILDLLGDPSRFVEALPNVSALDWQENDDGSFTATIRPATALGELPIHTVWRPQRDGETGWRYRVEGRTDEHLVWVDAAVKIGEEDGVDVLIWNADLRVTGTLRSATQRTLSGLAAAQAGAVVRAIDRIAAES